MRNHKFYQKSISHTFFISMKNKHDTSVDNAVHAGGSTMSTQRIMMTHIVLLESDTIGPKAKFAFLSFSIELNFRSSTKYFSF